MDEVILVRHGESDASLLGTVSGDPAVAVALTDEGRAQASRLGELLADEPIDLCVVSEFGRVQETADIALAGREVPRLVLPDLNDIRFGEFEGKPFEEYVVWAGSAQPNEAVAGGESRSESARRYVRGFRTVLARPERLILVVGHGLPIRYVLNAVGEIDPVPVLDQVGYAEPHRLSATTLARAIDRLEAWCAAPSW